MDKGYARCRPAWGRRIAGIGRGRALEPPFGPRDDVMWACPSFSGCDSEIAFPLDAGCKRQGIKVKFEGYTALARGNGKLRFTITAMEQEREGEIERLRKRQATTPYRPVKRSRLLEAKLRSKTMSRRPQMTAQLGHFQLLTPRGNPKRVYVYSFAISRNFLCFFWLVAIRLVACTQL